MHIDDSDTELARTLLGLARAAAKTEQAAVHQCQREAERLRRTDAVGALSAIAQHAQSSLELLPSVIASDGLPGSLHEGAHESSVSAELREALAHRLSPSERSYRNTLLNLRHGVALMANVWVTARQSRSLAIIGFCEAWTATRIALIEQAESELFWLMKHPERGFEQRWLAERDGQASNVGEDETSGSE